jgi:hypothetical protein
MAIRLHCIKGKLQSGEMGFGLAIVNLGTYHLQSIIYEFNIIYVKRFQTWLKILQKAFTVIFIRHNQFLSGLVGLVWKLDSSSL